MRVTAVSDLLLDPCWGLLLVSEMLSTILSDRRMRLSRVTAWRTFIRLQDARHEVQNLAAG